MTLAVHLDADPCRRTPDHILVAAREVLGTIDLDPASDEEANKVVGASAWWGSRGLQVPWFGRVWLNPPGGKLHPVTLEPVLKGPGLSSAAVWWSKLLHEYESGRVTAALFLGFTLEVMRTGQKWGKPPQAFPFCVPTDRLEFPSSNGSGKGSPPMGSVIVYLGADVARFREVFGKVGYCT